MNAWSDFVRALGQGEEEPIVTEVCHRVGELPIILETPDSYDDPVGKTKFYKFFESGLEFGFRAGKLNHIHFFVQAHERYSAYRGDMLGRVAQAWSEKEVLQELGHANKGGQGRLDMLIGYVHPWVKYEFEMHALRMEFSKVGNLWKATLMSA